MLVDFGFVVATHGDLSEADADFSAIERLYEEQDARRGIRCRDRCQEGVR